MRGTTRTGAQGVRWPTLAVAIAALGCLLTAGLALSGARAAVDERPYNAPSGKVFAGVSDTGDVNVAWSWDTTGLPACGYRLVLRVWDRTIQNDVRPEGEPGFRQGVPIVKYYCLD